MDFSGTRFGRTLVSPESSVACCRTAQGVYMVQNAKLYAQAAAITDTDAIFMFAGYFAVPFLIFEVLFKLMQVFTPLHCL